MDQAIASIAGAVRLVLPETVLVLAACAVFAVGPFVGPKPLGRRPREFWCLVSLVILGLAAIVWLALGSGSIPDTSVSLFRVDAISTFVHAVGFLAGFVLLLMTWDQIADEFAAESQACFLLILAGTLLVGSANDLTSLFLSLELISIPTYIVLYLARRDALAQESTVKYFMLSIFSSGLLLYGLSFFYGCVGSTNLEVIQATFRATEPNRFPSMMLIAVLMVVAGLGFRVTAVPFHFYAPDVFQGTRLVHAAMLSFVPKLVGFVALLRLLGSFLPAAGAVASAGAGEQASMLLWAVALLTMTIGNVLALLQSDLKRLLAYSSVAHAGYMLAGLAAIRSDGGSALGAEAVLFYVAVYGAMTVGLFAVLLCLDRERGMATQVDDLAGLGRTRPWLAGSAAVFLFSLTGLPPTAGFFGKLYIFLAAWSEGSRSFRILAVFMALNAAIGGWYYLRIVGTMFLRPGKDEAYERLPFPGRVSVALCLFFTLWLFLDPKLLFRLVSGASV